MIQADYEVSRHEQLVEINTNAQIRLIQAELRAKVEELEQAAKIADRYRRMPAQVARERMAASDVFWDQIAQVRGNATLSEDDKDLQIESLLKAVAQFLAGHG